MDFSSALKGIKAGHKVARAGWDGVYLEMQVPDEHSKITEPYIYITSPSGDLVTGWGPSNADLFADDWELV